MYNNLKCSLIISSPSLIQKVSFKANVCIVIIITIMYNIAAYGSTGLYQTVFTWIVETGIKCSLLIKLTRDKSVVYFKQMRDE